MRFLVRDELEVWMAAQQLTHPHGRAHRPSWVLLQMLVYSALESRARLERHLHDGLAAEG